MPRDGAGNYSLPSGNPVVTNTIISSGGWANPTMSDIASALTQSLSRDGQTTPTADLTMGNFKLRSLANAIARTDAVNAGQVQDNQLVVLSSIGGTGDAITASTVPAITSIATDSKWVYTPTATNTLTNPTININGLGAKTITQSSGVGLWSGALVVGTPYELLYDGTNFRVQSGQLGTPTTAVQGPFAFRNYIIDGNFDFWNANTTFSFTGGSGYTADVWLANSGTGGSAACTINRITPFTPGGEPAGITLPYRYAFQYVQTAAASSAQPFISHRIESVTTLEGRSATLSMWLWCASGTMTINQVAVSQIFGTGGSATVSTFYNANWTVTTTPQRFSIRIDIPSISGKTLGTFATDFFVVQIQLPLNVTFTLATTQWQLEACPAGAPAIGLPTPFEWRGLPTEFNMVRRFYQINQATARFTSTASSQTSDTPIYLSPPMRANPAVSLLSAGTRSNISTATALNAGPVGGRFEIVAAAAGDTYALLDNWIFDARF
jgi:hypothetical protein